MDFLKKEQPKAKKPEQSLSFNSNDLDNVPVPPSTMNAQAPNTSGDPELDRIQKSIDASMQESVPSPQEETPTADIEDSFSMDVPSPDVQEEQPLVPSIDDFSAEPETEPAQEMSSETDLPDLPELPQEMEQEESMDEEFSLPNRPDAEDMPSQEEIEDVFSPDTSMQEENHEEYLPPTAKQTFSEPTQYVPEEIPAENETFIEAREFYDLLQGIKALKRSIKDAGKTLSGFESTNEAFEKKTQTLLSDVDTMQEQLIQIDEGLFEG